MNMGISQGSTCQPTSRSNSQWDDQVYTPTLSLQIRYVISGCTRCQQAKGDRVSVLRSQLHLPTQKIDGIAVDIYGAIPLKKIRGFTKVLSIQDVRRGFVLFAPISMDLPEGRHLQLLGSMLRSSNRRSLWSWHCHKGKTTTIEAFGYY